MAQTNEDVEHIIIPDDEGNEETFEVLYRFDVDQTGKQYMMVVPAEDDAESEEVDEVYAFRYEEEGDDISLFVIEDEDEWKIVEETFNTLVAEEDL